MCPCQSVSSPSVAENAAELIERGSRKRSVTGRKFVLDRGLMYCPRNYYNKKVVRNMSKSMALTQIEQQIEALPPVEQIMMLERIVRHLKQLLLARPITATPRTECEKMTEKLNHIYQVETSRLDPQLFNAQFASIGQDEWR